MVALFTPRSNYPHRRLIISKLPYLAFQYPRLETHSRFLRKILGSRGSTLPMVLEVSWLSGLPLGLVPSYWPTPLGSPTQPTAPSGLWSPLLRVMTPSGSPTGSSLLLSLWLNTSQVRIRSDQYIQLLTVYLCRLHCWVGPILLAEQVLVHGVVHGTHGEQRGSCHLLQVRLLYHE